MRILDESGREIKDPDLEAGYLTYKTITTEHPAVPEVKAEYKTIQLDKTGKNDVLLERVKVRDWQAPVPAYTTKELVEVYHAYTPEELAEQERQKVEAEESAKRAEEEAAEAAAQAEILATLPGAVDELAALTAENTENIELQAGAIEELSVLVAAKEENNG